MSDDFAATTVFSAFSSTEDVAAATDSFALRSFDRFTDGALEEDSGQPPSTAVEYPTSFVSGTTSNPLAQFRAGLTLHFCRGAGEWDHLEGLVQGLRSAGWQVEDAGLADLDPSAFVGPDQAVQPGTRRRVALGLGIGGTLAMWQGWDKARGAFDGVVAICPFLGFDAPMFQRASRFTFSVRERAFGLACKAAWRPLMSRIECVSAYSGMGSYVSQPISWTDLVACSPSASFEQILGTLNCPTFIVLDRHDPDLDPERAQIQIPAMSQHATVQICSLEAAELLDVVEHALFHLFNPTDKAASMPFPLPPNKCEVHSR